MEFKVNKQYRIHFTADETEFIAKQLVLWLKNGSCPNLATKNDKNDTVLMTFDRRVDKPVQATPVQGTPAQVQPAQGTPSAEKGKTVYKGSTAETTVEEAKESVDPKAKGLTSPTEHTKEKEARKETRKGE